MHEALGCQAVVCADGLQPGDRLELIEHGQWQGTGVLGPEAFDPDPFMEKMRDTSFPTGSWRCDIATWEDDCQNPSQVSYPSYKRS